MLVLAILVIAGAVLICLEVFAPGILLGILGIAALVAASIVAYSGFGMMAAIVVGLLGMVMALTGIIVEFLILPKTKLGKKLILAEKSGGKADYQKGTKELMQKEGFTLTVFAPSGRVKVDNKIYEAYSLDGHLEKNEMVRIVGIDNFRLFVKRVNKEPLK